jgi:hypothetical protein
MLFYAPLLTIVSFSSSIVGSVVPRGPQIDQPGVNEFARRDYPSNSITGYAVPQDY